MSSRPRPPRSQTRQGGPSRGAELRDRNYEDYVSRNRQGTTTQNHAHTTRERRTTSTSTRQYDPRSQREYEYDSSSDLEQDRRFHLNYQRVHRDWQVEHNTRSDLRRVLDSPALRDLESLSRRRRSASRQSQPISNEADSDDDEFYANSRRLGYSNLQQLNRERPRANAIDRWYERPHREEQYDAVGYVGRRSDYDRRREYEEEYFIDERRYDARP